MVLVLGFLSCIGIGIGIVKSTSQVLVLVLVLLRGFPKYWYWYWDSGIGQLWILHYKIGMNEQKCLAIVSAHKTALFEENNFVCTQESETFLLIHTNLIL